MLVNIHQVKCMLEIVGIHQRIAAIYIIDQQTVYYERKIISAVFDWVGKDDLKNAHYCPYYATLKMQMQGNPDLGKFTIFYLLSVLQKCKCKVTPISENSHYFTY